MLHLSSKWEQEIDCFQEWKSQWTLNHKSFAVVPIKRSVSQRLLLVLIVAIQIQDQPV